jgi:hypothetical protein
MKPWPNQRDGVNTVGRILSAFECRWPGATHREH